MNRGFPFKIAMAYTLLGGLWFFFSDDLIQLFIFDPMASSRLHMIKSSGIIIITACIFYVLMKHYRSRILHLEKEVGDGEERLRRVFQIMPVMVEAFDEKFNIIIWNKACAKVSGYRSDEIMNNSRAMELLYPDSAYRKHMIDEWVELNNDYINREWELTCKDGNVKQVAWYNISGRFPVPGWGSWRIGIDVTDSKREKEVLNKNKELIRLLAAIEKVAESIVITDGNKAIEYVNPSFECFTGYRIEEIAGQFLPVLFSEYKKIDKVLEGAINCGKAWSKRIVIKKKDGSECEVNLAISTVRDESGSILNYAVLMRDVADEVKMEKRLNQAQKMEALGTLAGGIAHDFNNILAAIIGYTEIASLYVNEGDKAKENMKKVLRASERARDLVTQILSISRQSEQGPKPVQLAPIVKETLKLLRASLPATIEIYQDIEDEKGAIEADPTQIYQILLNLCNNAAHAMRDNGGLLEVRLKKTDIDAAYALAHPDLHPGAYLRLTVRDAGHGIAAEDISQIFEPYFTTKKKGEGTGLGLAVIHDIVESYGGGIMVESDPGRGATFSLYFPQVESAAETGEKESVEPIPTGQERILFVDDEQALADIGSQMVGYLGYEVMTKTSSTEALELFREQPDQFDLVITDMTMPKMTGDKLARQIMQIRSDIPVIICTGYSDRFNEKMAKEMGIKAFTMKPLVLRDLGKIIREVLDNTRH